MTCNRNDCDWQATDDTCIEMIRKALDEMGYQHHDEVMDWLGQKVKQARLGAAVEAIYPENGIMKNEDGEWSSIKYSNQLGWEVCRDNHKTALEAAQEWFSGWSLPSDKPTE